MIDIRNNEIHLWVVEDKKITNQLLLEKYKALLNSEEKKRLERFVFPKHKKQFLITRALLRSVLGQYFDRAPESLVFARNAYGKPKIGSFEKSWPISFNLSHTNALSVLAVTRENELGVDVEYINRKVDSLKLANRYFSTLEYNDLSALNARQLDDWFFKLWTLKEAYIKAYGMGLAIRLRDFSFNFNNNGIDITFAEKRDGKPEFWQFWQFDYKSSFQLALAMKLKQKEALYKIVTKRGKPLEQFSNFKITPLIHTN
ncbi:MAG: 4'-phosphopantetheinyl transferase family protein [Pseudohongiellaceae bacterium]